MTRVPGLREEVRGMRRALLVDDDDAVSVREGFPVRPVLEVVVLQPIEEGLVVDLEADVVGDAAAELRDLEEHPVGEAIGREEAVVRPSSALHGIDGFARPVVLEPGLVAEKE